MLDDAGIRHRVIAISACYSGGWLDALTTPSTLIMTAADATHTSYGCGTRSELTFFGRAVFHEQLRSTYSFTEAFTKAVPIIAQREVRLARTMASPTPDARGAEIDPCSTPWPGGWRRKRARFCGPAAKAWSRKSLWRYHSAQLR